MHTSEETGNENTVLSEEQVNARIRDLNERVMAGLFANDKEMVH